MANQRKYNIHNRRPKLPVEHSGFYPYLQKYLEALALKNYSPATIEKRDNLLRRFIAWSDERGLQRPQDTTKHHIQHYQKHLHYSTQANGDPLQVSTQGRYLSGVKHFFQWLSRENHLLFNPAADIELPRDPARLPSVLSEEDIERVMQQPDLSETRGLRDRAILELLYSTGIRRKELCQLQLDDIDLKQQTVMIRKGKGNKDRLLPLGARAGHWIQRYLDDARLGLTTDLKDKTLFLNNRGQAYRDTKLGDCVKRYLTQAGIRIKGSCHLLRHAMATHMLENGADLRFIQAMLGHANAQSTQIYTHVSIRKLQEVHTLTHPAKLENKAASLQTLENEQSEVEG